MRPSTSYQPNAQYLAATMYGNSSIMNNSLMQMQGQYRIPGLAGNNIQQQQQSNAMHEESSQPTSAYANTSLMIRGQQLTRISETEILDVFQKYAPVKDIRLVRNKQSGQLRDFAFVEFFTIEEADRVLQQVSRNDFRLLGQPVMVAFSRSKPKREDENIQSTVIPQIPVQQQNYFREESMDKMLIQEAINQNQQLSANYDYQQQVQQQQQQSQSYNYQQSVNYSTDYQQPYYQSMQIIQQQQHQQQQQQQQQPEKQLQQNIQVIQEEIIQPPQPNNDQQQKNQQSIKQQTQQSQQEQEINVQKQKAILASVFSRNNEQEEIHVQPQQQKKYGFKKDSSSTTKGPKTEAENRKQIEIEMKKWEKEEVKKLNQFFNLDFFIQNNENQSKAYKQNEKLKNKLEKDKKKKKEQPNQLEILVFNQKDPEPSSTNDLNIERIKIITSHSSESGLAKLILCTICKRKFQNEEILRKHELFSELHKKNIEKVKKEQKFQ